MKDFESRNYAVIVGTLQARGTFYILRKSDQTTTLRYTGSEGVEDYESFRATYRQSRKKFDSYCYIACEFYNDDNERVF